MYMHHVVHAVTLPEAYHRALGILNACGDIRLCPAYNTREKSIAVTIDIARPLEEPRISKLIPCDAVALQQYLMEMEWGILDFEARETHNWAYTYHDRMIEQLIKVIDILRKDSYSRQAVALVRRPEDNSMDDPPCLTMIQYMITDGKLDCFVTFRSNDAVKAFFMNAFALIDIQMILADILGVNMGRYIHAANSFHAYERDWDRLNKFHSRIISNRNSNDLMMSYEDDWKDLMNDAIPHIKDMVDQQMKKHNIHHPGYFVGPMKEIILKELGE